MPSTAALIENARVSSPAIAAGAVRWKNDSTKLASTIPNTTRRARTNAPSCGRSGTVAIRHCSGAQPNPRAPCARARYPRFDKMAPLRGENCHGPRTCRPRRRGHRRQQGHRPRLRRSLPRRGRARGAGLAQPRQPRRRAREPAGVRAPAAGRRRGPRRRGVGAGGDRQHRGPPGPDRRARQLGRCGQALRARRPRRRRVARGDGRQVLQLHPPHRHRDQADGRARPRRDRQHHRRRRQGRQPRAPARAAPPTRR